MKKIIFAVIVLIYSTASIAAASFTKAVMSPISTAGGTTCAIAGGGFSGKGEFVADPSTFRVFTLGTKVVGPQTYRTYSAATISPMYMWVDCYNTRTGAIQNALFTFDSSTVGFPLSDKILKIK